MIALAGALTVAGGALAAPGALKAAAEKSVAAASDVPAATFSAKLTGASEVPPADPDGTGSFTAKLNAAHDQLCYELKADKVDTATAAHVHSGAVGVNGPPVVMLDAPVNGVATKCAAVTMDLAMKLMDKPQDYYVNVHNAAFPGGAIRGQLAKAP
jgi:hypothetical protein